MPLNVLDNYGKQLGVIVGKYANYYVVALTDELIGDYMDKFHQQLKSKAAQDWQCKNMFGKINEEKFNECLRQWVPSIKEENFNVDKTLNLYALNKEDINQYGLAAVFSATNYLLTEGKFMDEYYNIKLGLSTSRIPGIGLIKNFPALVGEIATIPEVSLTKNTTSFKINTGDVDLDFTVPGVIFAQKGQEIALELDTTQWNVTKVLVNGIIYHL